MKRKLLILMLLWLPLISHAQNEMPGDLEAYFSAIIISDIDASINWYENVLGFEVINKVESEERGFKQANLKRGEILLELIELDKALDIKDVVPNYNNKMRTLGLFKIGFRVTNFDQWIPHVTDEKVDFYGSGVITNTEGKRMVIITDPDGNRIQFFEK